MKCADLAAGLTDFLDGSFDRDAEMAALEHLATCSDCEAVLSGTREAIDLVKGHGRQVLSQSDRDEMLRSIFNSAGPAEPAG